MAETSKLELLLLAKDKMSPALQKLLSLLKKTQKDGKSSTDAVDKLTKKLERTPKTDGLKKASDALKKTVTASSEAAKAEEKLNNARKKSKSSEAAIKKETDDTKKLGEAAGDVARQEEKLNRARKKKTTDNSTAKEISDKEKLANANKKAAASEEKLNNARKRGSGSRRRDERSDGKNQSLRDKRDNSLIDDAALTGAGATGLLLSKQGISAAISKQEALSNLYTSFYRSSVSAAELNSQMARGEEIADRLGNRLPGTTATFLELFSVMKQRGIEANVILQGAGESAAYLAVANKEDVNEVGANIARFGQLFNLKNRDEYMNAADLMSKASTTYGINSSELMEAVKDFSGRTGKGLGIEGGKGAEDTLRFLAFLRAKTGLEGMTVGNASSSFFSQYLQSKQKKKDPTEELKKLTGVDLQIFDKGGKFLGLENAVREFSKLKGKLSDEKMLEFGNSLAGEEGASVFQAMVKNGGDWSAFNSEMSSSMNLLDKSAKNADNLSNKIEALTGSLENLGSASFTPMLAPLSKITDATNDWVGSLTEAAKANPSLARMITTVLSLGSAFLTLKYGGGMLSNLLGGANSSFATAWKNADGFQQKMGALRKSAASPISVSLQVMAAGVTIDHILKVFEEVRERSAQLEENNKTLRQQYDSLMGRGKLYNYSKETGQNRPELDAFADKILETMKQGRALELSLQPERAGIFEHFWTAQRPYDSQFGLGKIGDNFGSSFDANKAVGMWKSSDVASGFRDPNVLARILAKAESGAGMNLNNEGIRLLVSAIEQAAGKEKTQQARDVIREENRRSEINSSTRPIPAANNINQLFNPLQQTANQTIQNLGQLKQPTNILGQDFLDLSGKTSPLGDSFSNLNSNAGNASGAVLRLGEATSSVAARFNNLQITAPSFSIIPGANTAQSTASPMRGYVDKKSGMFALPRARGGSVTKGNMYQVGEVGKEWFSPATSGSIISNDTVRANQNKRTSASQSANFNVTINVNGATDPDKIAAEVKRELANFMSEVKREWSPRLMAKKVAGEAARDSERT